MQRPPTPAFAATHAQSAIDAARNADRVNLDYSPGSLAEVDRIVGLFHDDGLTADDAGEAVFSFGCHVGEALVRNHGGKWVMPGESSLAKRGLAQGNLMVVEMPNGDVWNPIGKAFNRLAMGEGRAWRISTASPRKGNGDDQRVGGGNVTQRGHARFSAGSAKPSGKRFSAGDTS